MGPKARDLGLSQKKDDVPRGTIVLDGQTIKSIPEALVLAKAVPSAEERYRYSKTMLKQVMDDRRRSDQDVEALFDYVNDSEDWKVSIRKKRFV